MNKTKLYVSIINIIFCLSVVLLNYVIADVMYHFKGWPGVLSRSQNLATMNIGKDTNIITNYFTGSVTPTIYYVDVTYGNDSNDGLTKETAFRTIEKARDMIRKFGFKGVTVNIMEGVYRLSDTIDFDRRDSGENGKPNIYQAYLGDEVVISGGVEIDKTGWSKFQHKNKTIYKKNVGILRFNSLFVNDKRTIRAREPDLVDETPYYLVKKTDEESLISFYFYEGNIDSHWRNLRDVEVVSYMRWIAPRMKIDRIEGDKVYFQGSLSEGSGYDWDYYGQPRYFIENVFEGLDNPGEWYLDTNGDLYYYPLPGEDINTAEIIAPVLEQLISLTETDYVTFKDLTFTHTDWSLPDTGWPGWFAVSLLATSLKYDRTEHCSFEDNIVKHIGISGIGGNWNINNYLTITGNKLYDIGGNGIIIRHIGTDLSSVKTSCVIFDNIIHDVGKIYREGVGIRANGINMTVSHNAIYNSPYSGIIFSTEKYREDLGENWEDEWKINVIEYNEIYNVMQELNDGGGIYVSGQQPGSLIQNNYIHDILATEFHIRKEGTFQGIYVDEGGKGFIIRNNLVLRTDNALLMHKSPNNLITNNIFVDSDHRDLFFSAYANDPRDFEQPGNHFTKNIIYSTDEKSRLFLVNEENGKNNVEYSDYNLFYTTHPENPNWNLDWWKTKYSLDSHSVNSDPLFVDYKKDNFTLQDNSPAFDLGFENFDLSNVGPRKEFFNDS